MIRDKLKKNKKMMKHKKYQLKESRANYIEKFNEIK